jgi:Flp pilus assembly protein TadD
VSNLLHVLQGTARRSPAAATDALAEPAAAAAGPEVALELLDGTPPNAAAGPAITSPDESRRAAASDAFTTVRSAPASQPSATPNAAATLAAVFTPATTTSGWQALLASEQGRRVSLLALAVGLAAGLAVWSLRTPADDTVLLVPPPEATATPSTPEATSAGPVVATGADSARPQATTRRGSPPRSRARARTRVAKVAAPVEPATVVTEPAAAPVTPGSLNFARTTPAPDLMQDLAAAHAAFLAGDYAAAGKAWEAALVTRPGDPDALLGLAAVAARQGRAAEAETRYREVLRADPHNATAIAAMNLLPSATRSNPAAESALKVELAGQPAAAELHFALGLRYVSDGRWPEAQTEFFAAAEAAPANPDYAYNLAVALDRLGKQGPAVTWYTRALALAGGSQGFDAARVRARLATLGGQPAVAGN